jgi:hypothetical protein
MAARLQRPTSRRLAIAALACVLAPACAGTDSRLRQHQEKLDSLASTTAAIANAWLEGDVSGTFGVTALDQAFVLVEQERTAIASQPKTLADQRGARLADGADWLSRLIAATIRDLNAADAARVRQRLRELAAGADPK